nr:hypothetical protein [Gammaproteobacteria bacterium]
KISYTSNRGLITIYSGSVTDENIRNAINKKSYRMFMDLELTMPEFGEAKPFKPEILQMGCVVIDEGDNIVNYYSNYVKTKKKISTRTYRFLSLGP